MQSFGPYSIRYRSRLDARPTNPPDMVGDVVVEFDPVALADMLGPRALRSKGGVAKEARGLLRVKRI